MEVDIRQPGAEIKYLRACINDLIGVVALPAIWSGGEPSRIVPTFLEVLLGALRLDFVYVRLRDSGGEDPVEMVRVAEWRNLTVQPKEIFEAFDGRLGDDPRQWPSLARNPFGDGELATVLQRVGLWGEIGLIVAGSQRADFPTQTERLLLGIAANQIATGLQEARLLGEQKRLASELDGRVVQRTAELAAANEELRKEIAERRLVEQRLRQEERELKRSQALLAEAQRLSATGSFTWRVATDEITWSDESYRIFQIARETPLTFALIDNRVHPDDLPAYKEQIARARRDYGDVEFDFRLRLPATGDGTVSNAEPSIRYIHVVARASRDESGQLEYIGAVQDLTERRLSEQALNKVRSELARVARVTTAGVLTASIAHEVNQPLAGIITNANLCLRMLADDPPDIVGALDTARRTMRDGYRATDVITRLRALFANSASATESVDLSEVTREVIALSSNELQRNRVLIRAELAEGLPLVTGDRVQLQQVILNLLLNASDAMISVDDRPREMVIRTEADEGDGVCLSVRDVGSGFEPQDAKKLFEAFYTTKSDGMGIGLSVSRSIVENHHGRLWAVLNNGPGATFYCSIPGESTRRRTSTPALARASLVSVVDDDESVRESLPLMVRALGFAVQTFSSAQDFLASEYVERTGCLLLDVAMPGMSGPDLVRELALRRQEIPIVFMTAQADESLRPRVLELGAVECLFKPLSEQALLGALNAALRAS